MRPAPRCVRPSHVLAVLGMLIITVNWHLYAPVAQQKPRILHAARSAAGRRVHAEPVGVLSTTSATKITAMNTIAPVAAVVSAATVARVKLQCTNMAGPWYRKNGARYLPYDAVVLAAPFADAVQPPAPKLNAFELSEVSLAPGTRWTAAAAVNRHYLLEIDVDRLLWAWRALAKQPQPAGVKAYTAGWEHPGSDLRGHFLGHWISAASFAYASSADPQLLARIEHVINTLAACASALGGYLSAFPPSHVERFERQEPVWAPYYCIHKVMQGLLDAHAVCGSALALRLVIQMAVWIEARLRRLLDGGSLDEHWRALDMEYGGMNDVLWQLARLTGESRHRRLASLFDKVRRRTPAHDTRRARRVRRSVAERARAANRRCVPTADRRPSGRPRSRACWAPSPPPRTHCRASTPTRTCRSS